VRNSLENIMSTGAAILQPTYTGYVSTTQDALILFEACLSGHLKHVPRRPHDRERNSLICSGCVFIYEENTSSERFSSIFPWPGEILVHSFQDREGQNQRAFDLVATFVANCENELEDVAPRIRRLIEPEAQLQRAAVSSTATPSNSVVHQARLLPRANHLSGAHPIRSKRRLDQQQARNHDSGRSGKRTSGSQARMFCSVPSASCEANDVARSQQASPFLPRRIYPDAEEL